jgi:hypothetical protein
VLRIEFEEPQLSVCECCGGRNTRLTRFVYRNENAFAVYYAVFGDIHAERIVKAVISLGAWGEGAVSDQRRAFSIRIRSFDSRYEVMVTDADVCPWNGVDFIGRVLNRAEALSHQWINDVFQITDHIVVEDEPIKAYLDKRV